MATGHSLEHPATDANPTLGDFVEPREAQSAQSLEHFLEHEAPPVGAERVIRAVRLSDTSPPLYYLLLNVWTRGTGTSDAALRLFSTLWALSCLPLLWILGRKIGGRRMAWAACVLFTFSPVALYFSDEGRMYSLVWFLGLSLAWLTFELNRRGSGLQLILLWSLGAAAGLLTHYFFAFVLATCITWLWLHPGKLSRTYLIGAAALVGLLVLPWYLDIPDSLNRWRVTGGWLAVPLTWKQVFTAPFILAYGLLSGKGVWGGAMYAGWFAAGLFALLMFAALSKRRWRLFMGRRQLLWLWGLVAIIGPILFDLLMHTTTSTIWRYALPGLPAVILLAGLGISHLPRRAQIAFLILVLFAWLPGIRSIFAEPSRPYEPYPEVAARLAIWAKPSDLIIVHSIPSGVLGVARYLEISTPLASWVVQLGQRRVPDDMEALLADRCRVALVKVHDLNEPSPAEAWLREHTTLDSQDRLYTSTEILYFLTESPNRRFASHCPA